MYVLGEKMGCGGTSPELAKSPVSLTVGMAVVDDLRVVKTTIQSLRLGHGAIGRDCQIVVVDNKPMSRTSARLREFCNRSRVDYVPLPSPVGSAPAKEAIFRWATGQVTCVIDAHVVLPVGSLHQLVLHAARNPTDYNLWHGVMIDDSGAAQATHQEPKWGTDLSFGTWARMDVPNEPVEIPMHGMGLFACRTEAWLGFPPGLSGFGAEEGIIHEKFRQAGRKVLLLPRVQWWHLFREPSDGPVPFPVSIDDRFRNYIRGYRHLGMDESIVCDVYRERIGGRIESLLSEVGDVERFDPSADWVRNPKPREKERRPSVATMAVNFAVALQKYVRAGMPNVPEPIYQERLSTCQRCRYLAGGACALCGCPVADKALWATEACPEKRWDALVTLKGKS